MDHILRRRDFLRGAALGALAFTVGGAQVLLTPREARAQGVPFRLLKAGEAEFIDSRVETDWAEHQVATTVDFARGNALLGWYLGGLNFQVEHHLFPRVCHLHYPALSRIVEETCRTHRVLYRCEPSLHGALAANWRWLRRMGSAPAQSANADPAPLKN